MASQNTILLLHPAKYSPIPFLSRFLAREIADDAGETGPVIWDIDNKYYTAQVNIQPVPLPSPGDELEGGLGRYSDVDVVVYVFDGKLPKALHPALVKIMAVPRDISFAVRALPGTSSDTETVAGDGQDQGVADEETVAEMFDGIGLEFIDEVNPLTEEDDERPLPPLETIRQTFQTHMWPSLSRKPLHASSQLPVSPTSSSSSRSAGSEHATFDITFDPSSIGDLTSSISGPGTEAGQREQRETSEFPDLHELRAAMYAKEFASIDALDRFNQLTDGDNPYATLGDDEDGDHGFPQELDEEEYQKMENWLEADDEEFKPSGLEEEHVDERQRHNRAADVEQEASESNGQSWQDRGGGEDWLDMDDKEFDPIPEPSTPAEGFEDDFSDFQSGYPHQVQSNGHGGGAETLSLDPTPLLLHLQSVRSELAAVTDEDERRVRAGREVTQMLRTLGMDVRDDDDLGLDDIGLEGLLPGR